LFADFLQQQLRLNDPEQWEQAHEQAAKWFEAHGWIEEAVEHFLAGRQYAEVIRIVENLLPVLLQRLLGIRQFRHHPERRSASLRLFGTIR
jgi:LuxR family maltose regulon positive regulatory protein